MSADRELLSATMGVLPVGVIVVDKENRVVQWNERAEEFIDCVGRPRLYVGMTLDETHPGSAGVGMRAMVDRLREGRQSGPKLVEGGTRWFRVWYRPLRDVRGDYMGIAQVIETLDEEVAGNG